MRVTDGPAGTIVIHGSEGWSKPMRLTLITRHRKLVIVTGDDVAVDTEDDEPETLISNTGADLQIPVQEWVDQTEDDCFGFR